VGHEAILFYRVAAPVAEVVVAGDDVQPALPVELVQEIKYTTVGSANVHKVPRFPELITITDLDIGIPGVVVVTKGAQIETFVAGKGVYWASVSTVTIT
jgi:hypothetical protein